MKIRYRSQWKLFLVAGILLLLFTTTTVLAQETGENPVASIQVEGSSISWVPQVKYKGLMLTVSGPGDFYWQKLFEVGENPSFNAKLVGSALPDGQYNYEILVVPSLENKTRDDALAFTESNSSEPLVQTGAFTVLDGQLIAESVSETEGNDWDDGRFTINDQVIIDDLIVDGSACVGFDCVNGESFGFDTIRLKENNLRIKFQDTSTGTFPTNDWEITINDSTNGGASYFSVTDVDHSRRPFTIEAGAPANSLYVDDYGRVGLGTSTPVVVLHIKDSDTPTTRLEQDSSGGWTAQTWDLAGNESNFFIRDVTNGSKLPFRIQPNTPSNTLSLKSDGKVGIGTWSPDAKLEIEYSEGPFFHIQDTNATNQDLFYVADNGYVGIGTGSPGVKLEVNGNNPAIKIGTVGPGEQSSLMFVGDVAWKLSNKGNEVNDPLVIRDINGNADVIRIEQGNSGTVLYLRNDGSVGIGTTNLTSGAKLTVNGTISELSDFNAKENFSTVNGKEVLASLVKVPISTWSYKEDETATIHMGPTAQDFSKAFGLGGSDSSISLVDRDGVALAAIQGLNEIVMEKDAQIADLEARVDALEANGPPQSQLSLMVILPWLLFTIALVILAFTYGKRLSQKSSE